MWVPSDDRSRDGNLGIKPDLDGVLLENGIILGIEPENTLSDFCTREPTLWRPYRVLKARYELCGTKYRSAPTNLYCIGPLRNVEMRDHMLWSPRTTPACRAIHPVSRSARAPLIRSISSSERYLGGWEAVTRGGQTGFDFPARREMREPARATGILAITM
jgi:hypothetical protein